MQQLEVTLDTPARNLALDEALLLEAESGPSREVLRFWEPNTPVVVLGRAGRVAQEVHTDACERLGIPILRRVSGGGTIVTGPGCLMYALVLSRTERAELASVDRIHREVLSRIARALSTAGCAVEVAGISDLVLADTTRAPTQRRKFSGNSLRVKRDWVLYHGTLMYAFPLPLITELLRTPPRQPTYRSERKHEDFIANLPLSKGSLTEAISVAWSAETCADDYPVAATARLAADRYENRDWNFSR